MQSKITAYIKDHQLIPKGSKLVVALSGGPDSVFLLHLLANMRESHAITLIAAHLDHQWRANSHEDVLFCKNLAEQLRIPFVSSTIQELQQDFKHNGSQEAVGRAARRYFLEKVAHKENADAIAVAHHLQDQEETFFIRLIRGSSLTGLTGMLPRDGNYIRPLLETNKADMVDYLEKHKISYLTDPTNTSMDYLRNRIRAKVLPALQECDQRFDQNFLTTIERLQETEHFLETETIAHYLEISASVATSNNSSPTNRLLQIDRLFKLHPMMQQRIIVHWLIEHNVTFTPTQSLINEIIRFLKQPQGGTHVLHTSWKIAKKKNAAYILTIEE